MARGRPVTPVGAAGSCSVTELPNGRFEAVGRIRDGSGKIKKVKARGGSKSAARRAWSEKVAVVLQEVNEGDVSNSSTISEFSEVWLKQLESSMNTIRVYRSALDLHIKPGIGELRLSELTTARLERFLQSLEGTGTRQTSRAVLSGMCGLAVRWGVLSINPARETTPAKRARSTVKAMSLEEVQGLRDAARAYVVSDVKGVSRAPWLPWLIDFMLGTGVRIGEALGLRWDDVEGLGTDTPVVHISGTLVWEKKRGCYRQDHAKTSTSHRTLQLPPIAVDALQKQIDLNGAHQTDWCFPSCYSTPVTLSTAQRALRAARPESLEWVHFHTLRKTVATMIANNMSADAARLQLGHSDLSVTMKHYLQRPETAPGGVVLSFDAARRDSA